jgi:hypothetical protein
MGYFLLIEVGSISKIKLLKYKKNVLNWGLQIKTTLMVHTTKELGSQTGMLHK